MNSGCVRHRLLLVLFPFFTAGNLLAQTTDFQTWNSLALEKQLGKKWKASLEEEVRLQDNSTRLRTSYLNLDAAYSITDRFAIGGAYRFIIRPDEISNRIYSDISYSQPLEDFTIKVRVRVQHEFVRNEPDENYLRPQLSLEYRISKKLEPFIEEELFYQLFYYECDLFNESRTTAGMRYKFDKHHTLKGYYLLEKEFNVNDPLTAHVLGFAYQYEW